MNKTDLTEELISLGVANITQTTEIIDEMWQILAKAIATEGVFIKGFGEFKIVLRKARVGRNSSTGARIEIPPKNVVTFKPGKWILDQIPSVDQ